MPGIRKKFFFQILYALSQLIFPLVTYPYITRTIGAEGLGLVGYIEYVSGFIITIVAFGIPFYGVREAAKLQNDPQKLQLLFRQLFSIQLLISCLGLLIFLGIVTFGKQDISLQLLILGCANILLPAFVAEWYMQGTEAFRFTTIRSIVLRTVGLIAIFLFVVSKEDYVYYYLIIILVQAAVAISNLYKIGYNNIGFHFSGYKQHLKPLWHFFLTASIISVYVFFDVIILGWFTDEKLVGYYTLAIKLVKLSLLLVLSVNVILFPRISHLTVLNDIESIRSLLHKSLNFIVVLTLPIGLGFYFLAPQIVQLIAGDDFVSSIPLVQILSVLPFVIGLSSLFVYQVLVPFGKEKKLLLSVFVTCICSLILHIILVQLYKEKGTAVATTLTELIMTLLVSYFSLKTFAFSFPVKNFFQAVLSLLPFLAFIFICQRMLSQPAFIIALSLLPGMIVYLLFQVFVFKNSIIRDALSSLRLGKKLSTING
jgi:O-antigen/teichoic acid export membrane protein